MATKNVVEINDTNIDLNKILPAVNKTETIEPKDDFTKIFYP